MQGNLEALISFFILTEHQELLKFVFKPEQLLIFCQDLKKESL